MRAMQEIFVCYCKISILSKQYLSSTWYENKGFIQSNILIRQQIQRYLVEEKYKFTVTNFSFRSFGNVFIQSLFAFLSFSKNSLCKEK